MAPLNSVILAIFLLKIKMRLTLSETIATTFNLTELHCLSLSHRLDSFKAEDVKTVSNCHPKMLKSSPEKMKPLKPLTEVKKNHESFFVSIEERTGRDFYSFWRQ